MTPLMNRSVKHRRIITKVFGDEVIMRSLQTDLAVRNQFLSRCDASGGKEFF